MSTHDNYYNEATVCTYTDFQIRKMLVSIQSILFLLFFIIVQASYLNDFKPTLTCYLEYDHTGTRSASSNALLRYSYKESVITHYTTAEGKKCTSGNCACFSYRKVCTEPAEGSYHFSTCTDADQLDRKIKWYRGLTSDTKCEEMRQQPHIYLDLTCCYTDRCNNQPPPNITVSDTNIPKQPYISYNHQGPVPSNLSNLEYPPQRHEGRVHHPTTTLYSDTYGPSQAYDKSSSSYSVLSNSFSKWMIFFTLLFCLLVKV